jgi:hypothetical protein
MRYQVIASMVVDVERGPDPTEPAVAVAVRKLLRSDTMHVSVDLPEGRFEGARLEVSDVTAIQAHGFEGRSPRPRQPHGREQAQRFLRVSGALPIERLVEHGFRRQDITRWLKSGVLYRPYGYKHPEIVMVKR